MEMFTDPSKSILVGKSYQDFNADFGTKWKKCWSVFWVKCGSRRQEFSVF